MKRKLAAAAVVASMLGGAGAGIALTTPSLATAQTGSTTSTTTAQPKQVPQFVTDALKKLVDNGTITQAQSDAVSKALADAQPPRPPGGPGGPGEHHGPDLAVAAKTIGVSEADLRTALQSGKSIADVAKAHNVDPQKVIDALVADAKTHLADRVKAGEITQAQADQITADLTPRITDFVNNVRLAGAPDGDHGGRGPGGPGGPPPGASSGTAATGSTASS
jgi:hypothetical protein